MDGRLNFGVQFRDAKRCSRFAQTLEAVEGALLGQKNVDDEVHVIHQDPLTLAATFDRVGIGVEVVLEAKFDLIGDGDRLPIVRAGADQKIIGEAAFRGVKCEDADIFRLFVFTGCRRCRQHLVHFDGCHQFPLPPYRSAAPEDDAPRRRRQTSNGQWRTLQEIGSGPWSLVLRGS